MEVKAARKTVADQALAIAAERNEHARIGEEFFRRCLAVQVGDILGQIEAQRIAVTPPELRVEETHPPVDSDYARLFLQSNVDRTSTRDKEHWQSGVDNA